MRIVFIDLHCINFLVRPFNSIHHNHKIATYKHKFLIDYALENNIQVCNFISGANSLMYGPYKIYKKLCELLNSKNSFIYESNYVIRHNFVNYEKIRSIVNETDILDDDIVVCYLYNKYQLDIIKNLPGRKVCFLNHFISVNEKIDFSSYGIDVIVNEVDLSQNSFFIENFKFDNTKLVICPYTFEKRFYNQNIGNRKNKALIIGTLSTCKYNSGYKLYRDYFKTEWIQTQRKIFYDNKNRIENFADSYVSYINEDIEDVNSKKTFLSKTISGIKRKLFKNLQSKYTSFDMVAKFNEYSMFLCPEENADMPGIGCVEGMATGAAYIGLDKFYYKKLGFVPNENYIVYNGTISDLEKKVLYYSKNQNELKRIANNGYDLVTKHYNQHVVAEKFYRDLNEVFYE